MKKIRVGVLMGGKSIEREVSFNSGRTVCDHLDTSRYDIIPLFQKKNGSLLILPWHFLHRGKITDFEHRLESEAQRITWDNLKQRVDFIFIATHGRYAEDGTLQGFLEVLGIPYLGSKVFSSALCMDKTIQKKILAHYGVDVPRGITIYPEHLETLETTIAHLIEQLTDAQISAPYVIKPQAEGSSLAVSVVFDIQDLPKAIYAAAAAHPEKLQPVLIEEKIEGMEFSCITLTDYKTGNLLPLPPTEIVHESGSHFFDYEQKYMPGRAHKFTPARCSTETIMAIQQTCVKTTEILGITNFSRIDGFVTPDNRIVIIDPNTLSGMGPASFLFREAAEIDMSHTHLINHLIETELHQYGMLETLESTEKAHNNAMNNKKIRVAILMGGDSNEREISLESGRNITYKLSPHHYEAIPVFLNDAMELFTLNQSLLVRSSTHEIAQCVDQATRIGWEDLAHIADFVFIALHGGKGENGSVQGALEMLNIPYNGSSTLASALCMDKFKTTEFLRSQGYDVPQALLIEQSDFTTDTEKTLQRIMTTIPFPLIVKPHDDGCSVMVKKARTAQELHNAITDIFAQNKQYALVEECVSGMELTVGVIGNEEPRALPPSQTVATGDILSINEKFLPGAGENQTPAPLPKQALEFVQRTMAGVYKSVGCAGYARIDCFYQSPEQSPTGKERVITIEINTLPGMTPATCIFHQAAEIGIKPMDFVDLIIQLGFQAHRKNAADMANHMHSAHDYNEPPSAILIEKNT